MNELALFAGAGGGILGGQLLGWRCVCAVEIEPYCAAVLAQRQNDGLLPPFPIWDDVCTFDGKPWRGVVDVVSGGFPCQDISAAGKGAGIEGERSGMWVEMARIIGEVRPQFAFVENSPMLTSRGLDRVLRDLAEIGYDAEWGVLGAADVGAPHKRERIWIVAYSRHNKSRQQKNNLRQKCDKSIQSFISNLVENISTQANLPHPYGQQCKTDKRAERIAQEYADFSCSGWWTSEPDVGRVVNGLAARSHRLKAIGNGQVPQCAAEAFRLLAERINE